ncbi:MAG: thioredoxin-related protein [Parasphingorhabdus sp.]|jgi:thioredoxin-related protein
MMQYLILTILLILSPAALSGEIQPASDLSSDGHSAIASNQTVVVLFSSNSCPYCDAVKSEFFQHLENDKRYLGNIILREVLIDSHKTVTNFSGESTTQSSLADQQGIYVVPTVGFFDGSGQELAKRIVGVGNLDFYGWYLDIRIKKALRIIRSNALAITRLSGATAS